MKLTLFFLFIQIGEFDLAQEATPIVDEQLLEDVSRAAKSSAPKATPGIGKDIEIVRKQTSPHEVGSSASRETEALRASATQSHHSVDGPNSLEVATRGLRSADADVGTPGGPRGKLSCAAAPSTTSFCPGPGSQSIFTTAIRVMGSEYLTSLKNVKFEEVEGKLQSAPMIYKGIERLHGDPTPLKKKVEDYGSAVSAFLSLKKAASSCRHPDDVAKEKAFCTEQVDLARSSLATSRADLSVVTEKLKGLAQRIVDLEDALRLTREEERQLKGDVQVRSSLLEATEQEVNVKSKALADLEMVPTLSSEDAKELERHEQNMLALQSSLNPDTWMDMD